MSPIRPYGDYTLVDLLDRNNYPIRQEYFRDRQEWYYYWLRLRELGYVLPTPPSVRTVRALEPSARVSNEPLTWEKLSGITSNRKEHEMGTHTVGVNFEYDLCPTKGLRNNPSKVYYYRTNRDDINEGDYVVVMSPTTGPTVVKVREIVWNTKMDISYKYIIDKVDFVEYNHRQEEVEAAARERNRLRQEMTKAQRMLDQAESRLRNDLLTRMLEDNPEYQALKRQLMVLRDALAVAEQG